MLEYKTFSYVDESGNTNLDTYKDGVSKLFIVCAIIISSDELEELKGNVEKIRIKYFQTGEIKSSGVGRNDSRREKILKAINTLNFSFYALSIDKERIKKDSGLRHKRSFFKYINRMLYTLLFKSFSSILIVADEHGNKEYKESFIKYINKHHEYELFRKSDFKLINSKNEILVQLSDFIAGTIRKVYEKSCSQGVKEEFESLLSTKALYIEEWPTRYQARYPKDVTTDEYSQLIYQYSLNQAEYFIETNEKSEDKELRLQVATLRRIVFHSRVVEKTQYITSEKLINYLSDAGHGKVSKYMLRSKIIAPLRDSNVIITSSNKGYKIPCCFTDMEEFVERVDSIVSPLLSRLGRARRNLRFASEKKIEILKGANYPHLIDFIDVLEKHKK